MPSTNVLSGEQGDEEGVPYLFRFLTSNVVAGFDNTSDNGSPTCEYPPASISGTVPSSPFTPPHGNSVSSEAGFSRLPMQASSIHQSHCISLSMPSSPSVLGSGQAEKAFNGKREEKLSNHITDIAPFATLIGDTKSGSTKFYSQPMPLGAAFAQSNVKPVVGYHSEEQGRHTRNCALDDARYNSFMTMSGKLGRQISHLVRRLQEPKTDDTDVPPPETLPVERYFDALEGPELETLRDAEELLLPEDKTWPFLLRFPVSSFGICLGIGSQAILWKTLATSSSSKFLRVSPEVNFVLWCTALAVTAIVSCIYTLKVAFFFEAVRREFYHPIRINFFFAPWIACLFLALGIPPRIAKELPPPLWYVLMVPILCLELKLYGQWMSGGQRRLSRVANPSNHLSIVGNFVGALLGASMGMKEGPIFFFSVGVAHYIVLFVTLYQRLPTTETLPKDLHPVFFLFVAAPSVSSVSWARLQGSFDYGSRIAYFISMFLYLSLAVRVNLFRGFRFSLAWWAYTFPMTGASIATIKYADEVTNPITQGMVVVLSAASTVTVTALFFSTIIHAFVLHDLFPNDVAIAITSRNPKGKRCPHQRPEMACARVSEAP